MKVFYRLAGLPFFVASAAVAADGAQTLDFAQLDAVTAGSSLSLSSGLVVNPLLGIGGVGEIGGIGGVGEIGGIGGVGEIGGIGGPFGLSVPLTIGGSLVTGGSLATGAGGEVVASSSSSVTSD